VDHLFFSPLEIILTRVRGLSSSGEQGIDCFGCLARVARAFCSWYSSMDYPAAGPSSTCLFLSVLFREFLQRVRLFLGSFISNSTAAPALRDGRGQATLLLPFFFCQPRTPTAFFLRRLRF